MRKIYIRTYGCTLNQADSDLMGGLLRSRGFGIATSEKDADVVVLNTCTVKGATENKILERLKRLKEQKKIVVAGCLSINKETVWKVAPVPIVFPGAVFFIPDAVEAALAGKKVIFSAEKNKWNLPRKFTHPILRVPIQEGCTGNCYFCQTKIARPIMRSWPSEAIIDTIACGVKKGAREIQLTGMDSGAYGLERRTDLAGLMKAIASIKGNFFVRIGMINPNHVKKMGNRLLDAFSHERFYRFLHMPVQSGSEKVCREMNRPHTVKDFTEWVRRFRQRFPDMTIATDIIVGYPTETEEDFEKTVRLLKNVQPDVVNLSKFTPRPGTRAKEMDQLPTQVIKRRSEIVHTIVKKFTTAKNRRAIGRVYEVLITEKQKDFTGRNANYKQIVVKGERVKLGERVKVKIVDANHSSLIGEKIS